MAFMVSSFIGGLMLTSNSSSVGSMSGETGGGGLLRVSLKNYVHLALTSSFLEIVSPFLSLTAKVGVACSSQQKSGDLVEPCHVSLSSCSLSFLRELVDESSVVLPGAFFI